MIATCGGTDWGSCVGADAAGPGSLADGVSTAVELGRCEAVGPGVEGGTATVAERAIVAVRGGWGEAQAVRISKTPTPTSAVIPRPGGHSMEADATQFTVRLSTISG